MNIVTRRYKYISFRMTPASGIKTHVWECVSNSSGAVLGTVRWYGAWRQYCFFPEANTIFNKTCMENIIEFVNEAMMLRAMTLKRQS